MIGGILCGACFRKAPVCLVGVGALRRLAEAFGGQPVKGRAGRVGQTNPAPDLVKRFSHRVVTGPAEPAEGKYALTTGYSESALGGSSRVMARHPNDLVVLEDGAVSKADFYGFTSANSISNGKIYNWADAAMPDVCSIWGLCDGSRRFVWYADMIRDSGADFSVMEIDGVSLVSSPEKEAFFDPKTLFLTKYRIYEIPEEGEKTLSSGIEYSDYVVVSGYHVPTSVKITNYSERGEVTGAAEFSIDPGSIKINDEIEDGMKVAFPIGCVVVDQASGTEYTVTNATNVDKKENIIEGILDGILENSDAAKK